MQASLFATNEIFKDIPDYEGLYQVSNKGKVKSIITGKIRKTYIENNGYERIILYKNNKAKIHSIHRLVALIYIGKNNLEVNHIDGNKLNNNLENLEYCTRIENMQHAKNNNLLNYETLYKSVIKICPFTKTIIKEYNSIKLAILENDCTLNAIWSAINNNHKCKGYEWKYKN